VERVKHLINELLIINELFDAYQALYNKQASRPDICIGTAGYHTPDYLKNFAGQFFADRGYLTAYDNPYSGALTPLVMYEREPRLSAVMIELNRSLYMRTETGIKIAGFGKLRTCLGDYLASINEQLMD